MNPRIHHPVWYRLCNLITEEEESFATKQNDTICLSMLAQFRTARFRVICQPERWEVQDLDRNDPEMLPRLVHEVFDIRLSHTPVSAYAINFAFRLPTQFAVGKRLASILTRTGLGILESDGDQTRGYVGFQTIKAANTLTVQVTEGAKPTDLQIVYNYHYELRESGPFEIGPMIDKRAPLDRQDAIDRNNSIVKTLHSIT